MSDHDSDSDSNFSMEDVQEENALAETMKTIEALMASLATNPYQYNVYVELITLLKKQGMLDELRTARVNMNSIYPLSEDLWMSWIEDEAKLADSDEEKQAVIALYETATAEYLSIPLWVSYTDFMVQGREDAADGGESTIFTVDYVRAAFSKAYDAVKWHVAKSHLIWNAWLAFEKDTFADSAPPEDVLRVKKMCIDRLTVPHTELEKTFSEEVSSFVSNYVPNDYESTMVELRDIVAQTRKALSKLEKLEQALNDTSNSIVAYRDYIKYESRQNIIEYPKLRTLYERAVANHPLVPALWDDYLVMLMNTKQTGFDRDQVIQTCTRAVRNCPWSGALWAKYITLLGLYLRSKTDAAEVFERATQDPMLLVNAEELSKVCLEYCSFLRRLLTSSSTDDQRQELHQVLTKSQQLIQAAGGDPFYKLERFWINVEAFVLDNPAKARSMWNTILESLKTSASTWLESINMELRLRDYEKARRLFRMAAQTKGLDWPATIYDAWLTFEQENGGVDDVRAVYIAMSKHSSSLDQYVTQMFNQGTTETTQQLSESVQSAVQSQPDHYSNANRMESKKRKSSADHGTPSERTSNPTKQQKPATTHHHSSGREEDTCFFKNFSPETSNEELQNLFSQYGTIVRFIIPIDKVKKIRRGYGYVQFSDKNEAQAALALNGRDAGWNRGLIVQISDVTRAPTRSEGRPPPRPVESAHMLEITGFDNDTKESDIRKLFSLHGELKDVHIFRRSKVDGHLVAKVTFANSEDAQKALELNGTSFMTKVLNVQHWKFQSQDHFRRNVEAPAPKPAMKKTTMQPRSVGARGSMPPRPRVFARTGGPSSSPAAARATNETAGATTSKTQDDFRKLLQQRKQQ